MIDEGPHLRTCQVLYICEVYFSPTVIKGVGHFMEQQFTCRWDGNVAVAQYDL